VLGPTGENSAFNEYLAKGFVLARGFKTDNSRRLDEVSCESEAEKVGVCWKGDVVPNHASRPGPCEMHFDGAVNDLNVEVNGGCLILCHESEERNYHYI